jgi:hypothetical protein
MTRGIAAAVILLALTGLFVWQRQRAALVDACATANGIWDGTRSECRKNPGGPILERDLRRS